MKVFISWSGKLSGDVATLLSEWLPSAVPGTVPWLSKEGIEKGSIWFGAIEEALKETSVGVICLTRENMGRPWVLFEAGGLNKGLDKSRVCPLLLDLEDRELDAPLNQFHTTKPNKKDMLALCTMINQRNTGQVHSAQQLKKFFDTFWPEFEKGFTTLLKKHRASKPPAQKETPEMLEQILETVQALLRAMQSGPRSRYDPALRDENSNPWISGYSLPNPRKEYEYIKAIALLNEGYSDLGATGGPPPTADTSKQVLPPGGHLVLPGQEKTLPKPPKV